MSDEPATLRRWFLHATFGPTADATYQILGTWSDARRFHEGRLVNAGESGVGAKTP